MATDLSSTPIAPKGMGPGSVLVLIVLLSGLGAFYWLTHDPNVLDAYSDLKRTFESPPPAAPAPAPPSPAAPTAAQSALPGTGTAEPGTRQEEERLRQDVEEEINRRRDEMIAKLDKELAEAKGQTKASGGPALAFIAEPSCAPVGRQWLVSGQVYNPSDKVRGEKAEITLLIDGEPVKAETVEVGPVGPKRVAAYQVLFRPSRNTRHHTVTARASWKR